MDVSVTDVGRDMSYSADARTPRSSIKRVAFTLMVARAMPSVENARQAHGLAKQIHV